jgi:hypothetical protein
MVRVTDPAHCRAGDKGNTSNISVVAYGKAAWRVLREQFCAGARARCRWPPRPPVRRDELPNLRAHNFVIENALDGGVTRSLRQDLHGKSLSSLMLTIELPGHNQETQRADGSPDA